ncbi:hypothetical protein ACFYOT_13865 [Saccharothrix saharensis]|uniref:hypothetical protein n=1 Tax=Saccharothrix saharensis TaxID=571190 RepID=UPI00369B85ED
MAMTDTKAGRSWHIVDELPRDLVLLMLSVMDMARDEALYVPSNAVSCTAWCCWPNETPYRLSPDHGAVVEWLESRGMLWLDPYHLRVDDEGDLMEVDLVSLTDNGRDGYEMLTERLSTDG